MTSAPKRTKKTPLRASLVAHSSLHACIADGVAALEAKDRSCLANAVRKEMADSLNLDDALKQGHEQQNRWDYLLGHSPTQKLVAVEPHSAKQDEVSTVIKKRTAAKEQLRPHLRDGCRVDRWLWVASGKVHFADTEKTKRLLDQNGIEFVGTKVLAKHLPSAK